MKNTLIFVVFVLLVLGLLFLISGTRSPKIPDDALHRTISDKTACLECHGPGKEAALKKNHPPKDQCFICHKVKRKGARSKDPLPG
ncbi:MAG TPA: hypothetical protein DCP92_18860 [Nitrospiraceae bacterium]|jgi:hypothetical protein|nr:hypothetical protein [Nitrospiraceae bacterium]